MKMLSSDENTMCPLVPVLEPRLLLQLPLVFLFSCKNIIYYETLLTEISRSGFAGRGHGNVQFANFDQ